MCVERDHVLQHAIQVLYGTLWFYICEVSLLHCGMIFTILHGMYAVCWYVGGGQNRTHARLIVVWVVRELSTTHIYTDISIANYEVGVHTAGS